MEKKKIEPKDVYTGKADAFYEKMSVQMMKDAERLSRFQIEENISSPSCFKKEGISDKSYSEIEAESISNILNKSDTSESGSDVLNTLLEVQQNLSSYNKSYCRSYFESRTVEYTWEIDRVLTHLQIAKQLFSEEFPKTALYKIKLSIDIDTHNMLNSKVRFYLLTKEEFMGICQIFFIYNYAVNSNKGYQCCPYKGSMTDMTLLCEIPLKLFGTEILPEEKIVINFKFEILHQFQNQSIHMDLTTTDRIVGTNFNFERALLINKQDNDKESITFIVNKSRYNLSKILLRSINSTYFNKLCDQFEQNRTNEHEIKINDKKLSLAFEEMLIFILTGSLPTSLDYNKLKYILITADKYIVKPLKLTCECYLLRIINIQNSVNLIMLAFSYNAKFLEEKAATFIKLYLKEIMSYKNFSHLSQEDRNKISESINKINIPCKSQLIAKSNHLLEL